MWSVIYCFNLSDLRVSLALKQLAIASFLQTSVSLWPQSPRVVYSLSYFFLLYYGTMYTWTQTSHLHCKNSGSGSRGGVLRGGEVLRPGVTPCLLTFVLYSYSHYRYSTQTCTNCTRVLYLVPYSYPYSNSSVRPIYFLIFPSIYQLLIIFSFFSSFHVYFSFVPGGTFRLLSWV